MYLQQVEDAHYEFESRRGEILNLFERSEFLIATSQKKNMCVCSTNLGFSGEKKLCVCSTNLGFSEVRIMYQIRMYLVSAGRNLYVRTLCSARGRTRLTTVTSISCRSL